MARRRNPVSSQTPVLRRISLVTRDGIPVTSDQILRTIDKLIELQGSPRDSHEDCPVLFRRFVAMCKLGCRRWEDLESLDRLCRLGLTDCGGLAGLETCTITRWAVKELNPDGKFVLVDPVYFEPPGGSSSPLHPLSLDFTEHILPADK